MQAGLAADQRAPEVKVNSTDLFSTDAVAGATNEQLGDDRREAQDRGSKPDYTMRRQATARNNSGPKRTRANDYMAGFKP